MRQDPIKWFAAFLAKQNDQSYGEAEIFKQQYEMRMLQTGSAYTRRIPDNYQGVK
jgi:hypothetical protein